MILQVPSRSLEVKNKRSLREDQKKTHHWIHKVTWSRFFHAGKSVRYLSRAPTPGGLWATKKSHSSNIGNEKIPKKYPEKPNHGSTERRVANGLNVDIP